jgi:hypothetical protein
MPRVGAPHGPLSDSLDFGIVHRLGLTSAVTSSLLPSGHTRSLLRVAVHPITPKGQLVSDERKGCRVRVSGNAPDPIASCAVHFRNVWYSTRPRMAQMRPQGGGNTWRLRRAWCATTGMYRTVVYSGNLGQRLESLLTCSFLLWLRSRSFKHG